MDSSVIEFTPRPYQIELFEMALQENVIVCLKTGSGKTFIAVLLIKELSADIRRPYNEGGKRTIFIVNTVPLTIQHCAYIARLTGLSCTSLSGDLGVDMWSDSEWNMILREYQVLVMTGQILVDALTHGYIRLNRINLIIFDECHSAVNDHPMRQIMMHFDLYSKEEQPKILGLSATIINSNVKLEKIESVIQSLEYTFHAKVVTAATELEHITAVERIVTFDNYIITDDANQVISIMQNVNETLKLLKIEEHLRTSESSREFQPKSRMKKLQNLMQNIEYQMSDTGIYGAHIAALLFLIELQCKRKRETDEEFVCILEYITTEIIKCRKLLDNLMKNNTTVENIYSYTSHKILKLLTILKEQYNNRSTDRKFCCIIFVQRRYSAYVLFHILQNLSKYNEEYNFLKVEYMVGRERSALCYKEWFHVCKKNKEIVHQFRSGAINCIVATNIIEEGVDIPKCSLIISYNFPQDVRSYIQGKGRARHATSEYILLLCKSDEISIKAYRYYKVTEEHLRQYLKLKANKQCVSTEEKVKDELYEHEIEPYSFINKNGQKITLLEQGAVNLINMYCASLHKSIFSFLTPTWLLHKITGTNLKEPDSSGEMFKVSLKLPVVSPLKTVIFGDPMNTINKAKRSAAMKTCIELHRMNELSDVLMPYTSETLQQHYNYLFPNWIEDDKSDNIPTGTKQNKRQYNLDFPSALYAAFPLPHQTLYLHILHTNPKYFVSHNDNRRLTFYNLLTNRAGFCILSTKRMPEIPSFPLFMPFAELHVDVEVNYSTTCLLAEQITCIKTFHTLVFSEIVPVIKPFMAFDNYNRDNCFLVAPVDENFDLNWDVMKQYNCITRVPPPDPFIYKANNYELSLVVPTYRGSAEVYIVTQVCDNITPISCFPTDNFISYVHYYKEKHGLVITDFNQPMLEVKAISNKINYILPRHEQGDFTKRKQAEFQEHLVPQLCSRIDFPALYWLKATVLPSILHRISQLLIAEDLRKVIAIEAKLGTLSVNSKWPPLEVTDEEPEEPFELASESFVMENVDTLLPELPLNGLEIDVLHEGECHYPNPQYEDLLQLYTNIDEIQLIQIEHYCQHMLETNGNDNGNKKEHNKVNFRNKPLVSVPPLEILVLENLSGPTPVQIMYALTTASGQDAFNLERLEILGDSYLKFITTLFLYQTFPNRNEGALTILKGKIIGNRNLCYCGNARNIPGRMKVDGFIPLSNFIAPAYTVFRPLQTILLDAQVSPNVLYEIEIPHNEQLHGHISESTINMMHQKVLHWVTAESQTGMEQYLGIQTVSDKSIADCVEALIGVYVTSMGIKDAAELLKWFQILPNDTDTKSLLYTVPRTPTISDVNINYFMPWASDIETKIGYKFKNRQYLLQAFTHPSYTANNVTECYQRLEFLGDALLDFLITSYIYTYCGKLSPGTLTDLRSALVNNVTLACLAVRYGLHTALLFYAPELNQSMNRFVKFQEEKDHSVNDELLWILMQEEECNISEFVDVPKALGDIFESLIGAIYLDSNKNLIIVWEMVYSFMHNELEQFSKNIPKQAIRVLHEIQGAHPQFLNPVIIEETNTVMVPLKVTVAGTIKLFNGFGPNKRQAKCAAAKQALRSLLSKT